MKRIFKTCLLVTVVSLIGALVNVVLNFVLIPLWGAQGAAIATFVCYLVVFLVRAVNTQHYIRFDLHPHKLIINTVLTGLQCVLMLAEPPVWWLWQGLIVIAVFAINAKPILQGIMHILRRSR